MPPPFCERIRDQVPLNDGQHQLYRLAKSQPCYFSQGCQFEYDRMQSWNDCFTFFTKNFSSLIDASKNESLNHSLIDEASLQLAVYLASFGMYRNQFFLQSNRRILCPVIKSLFRKLDGHGPGEWLSASFTRELIFVVKNSLEESFDRVRESVNSGLIVVSDGVESLLDKSASKTYTAVSKILMGTTCCVPACDTNYRNAVRYLNKRLGKNSLPTAITEDTVYEIVGFVRENYGFFGKYCHLLKIDNEIDPVMRVFDLYMWQLGFAIKG